MTPEEIAEQVENKLKYRASQINVGGDAMLASENRRVIAGAIRAERERCLRRVEDVKLTWIGCKPGYTITQMVAAVDALEEAKTQIREGQ